MEENKPWIQITPVNDFDPPPLSPSFFLRLPLQLDPPKSPD